MKATPEQVKSRIIAVLLSLIPLGMAIYLFH